MSQRANVHLKSTKHVIGQKPISLSDHPGTAQEQPTGDGSKTQTPSVRGQSHKMSQPAATSKTPMPKK